ncbi:MAG: HEAT repeat domain-containing protein [Gemmatimonadaceae bacterium]
MRVIGLALAAALVSAGGTPSGASAREGATSETAREQQQRGSLDVTALLTSARGAPPMICAMAAESVREWGWGWGDANDAPSTPLKTIVSAVNSQLRMNQGQLATEDIDKLMTGLSSDDACVREISVRLLGTQKKNDQISKGFIVRLANNDASVKEVAAFGLGLAQPTSAVDPLIQSLRDASPGVRANAAWALGRIDNGRALASLVNLFRDDAEIVREAAVIAVGHMESTSTVGALVRVLREDNAASVRRVAAWALGEAEAREAGPALSAALAQDADTRVREMAAWALGSIEDRNGVAALTNAVRRDADDRVRETAVWALAQIEDRSSLDVLGAAAGSDKSSRVRGTAAWAIGQLDGRGLRAPAGLLQVLKDESDDARLKAAWALGQIGDSAALPAIKDALRTEQSEQVRRALIRAMMKSGERSEATLTELLRSSDPRVREAAVRGLAGGHSFDPWPWPWPRPRPFP